MSRAHGVRGWTRSSAASRKNDMKHQTMFRKTAWLLALCVASAFAFSGCSSASDSSTKSAQPQKQQPQKEHPEHPTPANTNK
jgi:hypothetical protein